MELEKLFEVKMIKILIVGLMLIASGSAYSGGQGVAGSNPVVPTN